MKLFLTFFCLLALQAQADPIQDLWDKYKTGQLEAVVTDGRLLLQQHPDNIQANLAVGRAQVNLGHPREALPYLERAAAGDTNQSPVYAWAQVYLGWSLAYLGDLEKGAQALIAARDCGATRNATREAAKNLRVLGLDEFYDDWIVEETEHFQFHFSPRLGIMDRSRFTHQREEALASISDWFAFDSTNKIRFFVWADPVEAEMSGMPPLGFARPGFYLIHAYSEQTRGHEITHVISHHAVTPLEKRGLINEGIAIVHDQTDRDTLERARQAVALGRQGAGGDPFVQVGIRALWQDWQLLSDTYSYPIAAAFTDKLLEKGGKDAYLEFFADQTYAHARQIYGPELEKWIDEFEAEIYESP